MAQRPRVAVDTNVFISAFLFRGTPALVLDLTDGGAVELVYSATLREETERILGQKFDWAIQEIAEACDEYWLKGLLVRPLTRVQICDDPRDDYLIECAMEGAATYLITGDNALLRIGGFGECAIVTPAEFLEQMRSGTG